MTHPEPGYRFERFFATRRVAGLCPAPDGDNLLFTSDISGQFNLWRIASGGGWPHQLSTFHEESVRVAAWSPDGKRIAFLADRQGNERWQIYLMDAVGDWPRRITHQDEVQHEIGPGSFSPDGRYLAYAANARHPHDVDLWLYDLATGESQMVCGGGGLFSFEGFSPDGAYLLARQFCSHTDQDLWLVDLATSERRNLTAHPGRQAKFRSAGWTKDGQGFYLITNDGREFDGIAFYNLQAGGWEYRFTHDWDVEQVALSSNGEMLAYTLNEAGISSLRLVEIAASKRLPMPAVPKGVISALAFAGKDMRKRLFLQLSSFARPNDLYVADLDAFTLTRVTHSALGSIDCSLFAAPQAVAIPSSDGLTISAWLYRPHGIAHGERVPAVLSIHAGPELQERTGYSHGGLYQYLLSQGVAVLAPNIRGSTGFGIRFQQRIHRDWGGAELGDIEACNHFLRSLDWIDGQRIGIWGSGFGGFASLSAAARLPDLWACACSFSGPSNLISFLESVPPHWKALMKEWLGDPVEDREFLLERSPITYVENLTAPLMVVQGAQDPRVVKAESDQMVQRLRALGREVEYLAFEDEGHGFTKRANQLQGYVAMADFLIRHLKG